MQSILEIPIELRLAGLFLVGICVGGWLNLAIFRFAYIKRAISPWSAAPVGGPPRRWTDRIPVIGWLGLRRESALHGAGFWIRPLAIEILTGLLTAGLYWWEVDRHALLLPPLQAAFQQAPPAMALHTLETMQWIFVAHALLVALMLVATFIDIDDRIIPDEVTIPGTLLGLALMAAVPQALLSDMLLLRPANGFGPPQFKLTFLTFAGPSEWPWLGGISTIASLAVGCGCFWLWCVALLPRVWRPRHGWRRAWGLLVARAVREPASKWILAIGLCGSLGIALVWRQGGSHWEGLLTSLVGMAAAGGLVWVVRIIGSAMLGREAMGFGDVTLMAMIGAFLGWQAAVLIFFLAPLAGLVIGISQWILNRDHEIPYGPFLCLGALVVIVRWGTVWDGMRDVFAQGWLVPAVLGVGVLAIVPLLFVVRFLGDRFRG